MSKPTLLVARQIFPSCLERLAPHFELRLPEHDVPLPPAQLRDRLQGCWGMLCGGTETVDAELLAACPDLQAVALFTVGYNNLDLPACRARGLKLSHAPGVLTEATADFGMALLLAAARRVGEAERFLRAGQWKQWSLDLLAGAEVAGTTLGIVGLGRIGQSIARRARHGFGMRIRYHQRQRVAPELEAELGAQWLALPELLAEVDHLMLVLPYSPATHHLIGAAELALMKPTAVLINLARGGIVDDAALAEALKQRRIAAAGLDVFEGEPQLHPVLLECENAVLTPHIASSTLPTRMAMVDLAVDNLLAWGRGESGPTPIP